MATKTDTQKTKLKNKSQDLKEALAEKDLDAALKKIKIVDNVCSFLKCKAKTQDFAITCNHCNNRFCVTHGLPEIHGCGEAVRREERRKFLHPEPKVVEEKHSQTSTKMQIKLKQMQQERKAKVGKSKKK